MKHRALILSAVAALALGGCSSTRIGEMLGIPGAAPAASQSAAVNVEMTREAAPAPVPAPVKKRRFMRRPAAVPGAADNAAAAAATPIGPPSTVTLPAEQKHGRMWRFFHRKKAKEAAARRAVETAPAVPIPEGRPATAPDGLWPKQ